MAEEGCTGTRGHGEEREGEGEREEGQGARAHLQSTHLRVVAFSTSMPTVLEHEKHLGARDGGGDAWGDSPHKS